jgi:hypothetical protein
MNRYCSDLSCLSAYSLKKVLLQIYYEVHNILHENRKRVYLPVNYVEQIFFSEALQPTRLADCWYLVENIPMLKVEHKSNKPKPKCQLWPPYP